jgi:hypothetical protein
MPSTSYANRSKDRREMEGVYHHSKVNTDIAKSEESRPDLTYQVSK